MWGGGGFVGGGECVYQSGCHGAEAEFLHQRVLPRVVNGHTDSCLEDAHFPYYSRAKVYMLEICHTHFPGDPPLHVLWLLRVYDEGEPELWPGEGGHPSALVGVRGGQGRVEREAVAVRGSVEDQEIPAHCLH